MNLFGMPRCQKHNKAVWKYDAKKLYRVCFNTHILICASHYTRVPQNVKTGFQCKYMKFENEKYYRNTKVKK